MRLPTRSSLAYIHSGGERQGPLLPLSVFGDEARRGMLQLSQMSVETERVRSDNHAEMSFGWRIYHLDGRRWWVRDQLCGFAQASMYVWFVSAQRIATQGVSHFEQSALKLIIDRLLFEHQLNEELAPHQRIVISLLPQVSGADDFTATLNAQSKVREAMSAAGLTQPYHVKLCLAGAGEQALIRAINERAQQLDPQILPRLYPHLFVDDWVIIPPGHVVGESGEEWHQDQAFSMSQTPVTQALYQGVMGETCPIRNGPLFPATGTSWLDAVLFCNQLSELLGLTPYYEVRSRATQVVVPDASGLGIRLPTRAEWCYAACGGRSWPYSGSDLAEEVAWSAHNSGSKVHQVARLKHNEYGLYDMSGNLWEWCHEGPQDAEREMICVGDHHPKWLLGGSWANHPWVFPIGETLTELPGYRDEFMGFRVVRHLAPSERGEIAEREVSDPSSVSQTDHQDLDDQVESSVQSPRGASATRGQQRADLTRDLRRPITSAEQFSWWVIRQDQSATPDAVSVRANTPLETSESDHSHDEQRSAPDEASSDESS